MPGRSKLGDALRFRNGTARPDFEFDARYPVYGANGVMGYSSVQNVDQASAVIGRVGSFCGVVHYAPGPCWVSENAIVAEPLAGQNSRFWFYALVSTGLHRFRRGTGQPLLNQEVLRNITLHIPPLPEQQAIAEVLGALDDKIAANRALVATLDELIRAHYLWALAEQRESRPMMSALNVTFGEAFKGEFFSPRGTGRPLLRIRDIAKGSSETWTTEERPGETIIEPGTVVAGMDADFTASFWLGNPSLLNQRVCSITSSEFGPAFAREIAQPALTAIANQKSGTTVIHLNKADMLRTTVDLPTGPSGPARSRAADGLLSALVNAAEESTTLASLRDTLLPALMDGTIRVKDAEGVISEAP